MKLKTMLLAGAAVVALSSTSTLSGAGSFVSSELTSLKQAGGAVVSGVGGLISGSFSSLGSLAKPGSL